MEKFEQKVLHVVTSITRNHLSELCTTWIKMFGHKNEDALISQLEAHYAKFFKSIVDENSLTETKLRKRLENLNKERSLIQSQLKEEIEPPVADETLPLYDLIKQTTSKLSFYRKNLEQRWDEVEVMKQNEIDLCKELNEPTHVTSSYRVLPTILELSEARKRLEEWRELKASRCVTIKKYQMEAREMIANIGSASVENSELMESDYVQPTAENVSKMEATLLALTVAQAEITENIKDVLKRLQIIWREIGVSESHVATFTNKITYEPKVYETLTAEFERCEKIKLGKIPELIEKLRLEIIDCMNKCMKSEKYRIQSAAFDVSSYDENALRRHQCELHHLKKFFDQNAAIFEMLHERYEIKSKLETQISNQNSKNRFKNRGGQLLKEEQEKKQLEKELQKIEVALCKAVDDYETKNNSQFLVYDEPILLDRTAKNRGIKKIPSLMDLRLKKPFSDRTNMK